jgi:hypothetical protein
MTSRQQRYDLGPLADFMAEDILSTPGPQLVEEVTEDCGDPEAFASAFDKIVHAELPNRGNSPAGLSIAPGRGALQSSRPLHSRWRRLLTALGNIVFPNRLSMAVITATCVALVAVIIAMPLRNALELRWKTPSGSADGISTMTREKAEPPALSPSPEPAWREQDRAATLRSERREAALRREAEERLRVEQLAAQTARVEEGPRIATLLEQKWQEEQKRIAALSVQERQEEQKRIATLLEQKRQEEQKRIAALSVDAPVTNVQPALATPPGPATRPEATKASLPEQIRQAQTELKRLGCFDGELDGKMNSTEKAIKEFWKRSRKPVVEINITDDFIADLHQQPDDICAPSKKSPPVANRPSPHKTAASPSRQEARQQQPARATAASPDSSRKGAGVGF